MRQVDVVCRECGAGYKVSYARESTTKWCPKCRMSKRKARERVRSRTRRRMVKSGERTWKILSDPGESPYRTGSEFTEMNVFATLSMGFFNDGTKILRKRLEGDNDRVFTVRGKTLVVNTVGLGQDVYIPKSGRIIKRTP